MCWWIFLCVSVCLRLSVSLSLCLSVSLSLCLNCRPARRLMLFFLFSVCVCVSVDFCLCVSVCLGLSLAQLPFYQTLDAAVCVCASVCLSVCLSVLVLLDDNVSRSNVQKKVKVKGTGIFFLKKTYSKMVFSGLSAAWFLAASPTRRSSPNEVGFRLGSGWV
jgi:hypothetical protein